MKKKLLLIYALSYLAIVAGFTGYGTPGQIIYVFCSVYGLLAVLLAGIL